MSIAETEAGNPQAYVQEVRPAVTAISVSIEQACALTGLGKTSIWALIRDGRLAVVRVPGLRRTLIVYRSLEALLCSTKR